MILFKNDWDRFPNAIPDYDTSNQSFLRMAAIYRKMGVKNCIFHLALLQPELKGVDPHSDDLTDEQKVMIDMECRYNPWYYFREVVRIPAVAGPEPVKFIANRGNIALIWAFFCNIDFALIQPRQTGKSVSTDTLMVYLLFVGLTNTTINLLTKDDSLRRTNISRLKEIRDLIPGYLVDRTGKDSDNQIEITCNAHKTRYTTGVSQGSERGANNLGRGMTVPINHVDEGPFINFISTTLPAALASGSAARDEAELNGTPYGNIFTTTAGKKDDRDGRYMHDFIHGGAIWTESYFDAVDREQAHSLVMTNCSGRKLLINGTFSHRQLGKTDAWLYEKITTSGATGEAADRDFFNVWTSGTQSSPLSTKLNEIIRDSECDPIFNEISRDIYIVRWYIPEEEIGAFMASNHCVIGLDTSEAVGRDSIGLVVSDIRDLATVASMTVNETNLIRFARFLGEFMVKYRNTTLVPERKSTGSMIVDSLLVLLPKHGEDPFRRIFNTIVQEHTERKEDYKAISADISRRPSWVYDKYRKYFGFNTTGDSRKTLYSTVLQNAAKKAGHLVRDRTLSTQIRGLVVRKGRIDHEASGHDDMVIAWLLGNWLLTQSRNLQHYGISISQVLSSQNDAERGERTPQEIMQDFEQERLREEMESIYDHLQSCSDDMSAMKYENRLRRLSARLVEREDESLSIDALIQSAKESREHRAKINRHRHQSLDRGLIWGGGYGSTNAFGQATAPRYH